MYIDGNVEFIEFLLQLKKRADDNDMKKLAQTDVLLCRYINFLCQIKERADDNDMKELAQVFSDIMYSTNEKGKTPVELALERTCF